MGSILGSPYFGKLPCCGFIGILEKKMETTIMGFIGILEKKMETIIMGYNGIVRYILCRGIL